MRQASSRDDRSDFGYMRVCQFRMFGQQAVGDGVSQGASYTGDLQAMRQSVMDENASRKREYLSLVLQTPEGGGKNKTVEVPLELRTVVFPCRMDFLQSEAFVGYKLFPVHDSLFSYMQKYKTSV